MKNILVLFVFFFLFLSSSSSQINWEHTNGPEGGGSTSINYNEEYAFCADQYFLYRSTDGTSWEKIEQGALWPISVYENKIVAQQYSDNTYYYTGSMRFILSNDNGSTWSEINMPNGLKYTTNLTLTGNSIFINRLANDNKFLRSQDNGQTWEEISPPFQYGYDLFTFEDRLYVLGQNGIWRSDINGENWISLPYPIDYNGARFIQKIQNHLILAGDEYLWSSPDEGQTWTSFHAPDVNFSAGFVVIDDEIYACSHDHFAWSNDYGKNWTVIPINTPFNVITSFGKLGDQLLASIHNAALYLRNAATNGFEQSNNDLHSGNIHQIQVDDQGTIWTITPLGLFKKPIAQEWEKDLNLEIPNYFFSKFASGTNGVLAVLNTISLDNSVNVSKDYGASWDTINPNSTPFSYDLDNINIVDDIIFINSSGSSLYRSDDGGETWTKDDSISPYQLTKFNNQIYGTNGSTFWQSADQGISWTEVPLQSGNLMISIEAAGEFLLAVFATYQGNGLYDYQLHRSVDGINWTYSHDGLPKVNDYFNSDQAAQVFEHQGNYYLYNKKTGLYGSIDTCQTWLPIGDYKYQEILLRDSTFYMGGYRGGVVSFDVPDIYGNLITGVAYNDTNNNGIKENTENVLPSIPIGKYSEGNVGTFSLYASKDNGEYVLSSRIGTRDSLVVLPFNKYMEVNPTYHLVDNGGSNINFGIHFPPGLSDLSIYSIFQGRPRPGFDLGLSVLYNNSGTTEPEATISVHLDPKLSYLNANPPPSAIIGDSLVWEIGTLPVFANGRIIINTNVPASTPLGEEIKSFCSIFSSETDLTLIDNSIQLCDTVVGSYDPNDKQVFPAKGLTDTDIATGKEIFYTVRFQNTGTYLAERVRITDQIDTALVLPSLRLVGASHDITSFSVRQGGLLEIIFDQINLPDSTSNEPESHGFVTFALQRNKSYNRFEEVRNTAAIYFDFNEPIITNEVLFLVPEEEIDSTGVPIQNIDMNNQVKLSVFPNPAKEYFLVSLKVDTQERGLIELRDAKGTKVKTIYCPDISKPFRIESGDLAPGGYFIHFHGKGVEANAQIIVF